MLFLTHSPIYFTKNLKHFLYFYFAVEDHFAKALGDTWIKLQKAEEEKRSKNKSEEKPTLVVSS